MALQFPHDAVFDERGRTLTFEDGTEIMVPEGVGVFKRAPRKVRITKFWDSQGAKPVTAAIGFEPGVDLEDDKIYLKIPVLKEVIKGTPIVVRENEEYPKDPTCTPIAPTADATLIGETMTLVQTRHMYTMQVVVGDK